MMTPYEMVPKVVVAMMVPILIDTESRPCPQCLVMLVVEVEKTMVAPVIWVVGDARFGPRRSWRGC